jgi:hypothetical protein
MLKNPEDLDSAIETLTKVMQQAAFQSTAPLVPHKCMNNIPLEIKQMLRQERCGKEPISQPIKPDITG